MAANKERALPGYTSMVCWFAEGTTYAIDTDAPWPRKVYKRDAATGARSVVTCTEAECKALPGCPAAMHGTSTKPQYAPHPLAALDLAALVKTTEPAKR